MKKNRMILLLILVIGFALSACGGSDAESTPTLSVEQIQTEAVMTYQIQLTQTAMALPTSTPFPTQTPIEVVTFSVPEGNEADATATLGSGAPAADCYGLAFVKDVTIPDDTKMKPGQEFTKTWLVQNSGTCSWEPGFVWNVVGGDALSGVAVTLNQTIEPGRQFEFSVKMIAPTDETGTFRGDWRLSNTDGVFFGETPWVQIVVGDAAASGTGTPTVIPTATETPTP